MRIKTSLTVVISMTIFLVATSLGVTLYHAGKVDQATEAGRLTDDLVEAISKLRFLTHEFQQYPSLRVQEQWQGVYRQVGQQVKLAQRLGGEYDLVKHLPTHYRAVGELFEKLIKTSEASKASPKNNILVELRIKLTSLLFLELQEIMSHITALTADIRREEAKIEKQASAINLICWSILFLTIVINAFILRRKIVRPLSHLEQGVAIIGAGNLDYRVGTAAPDEVGDLSRAFDAMAANLQEKAASLEWAAKSNAALAKASRQYLEKDPGEVFLDDFSHLILEQARSLTGSELGYVGYLDRDTGFLICPTLTRNIWETCQVADKTVVFKEFRGLWGWSLDNRQAVLTNDPGSDPRAAGTPPGHLAINRFLAIPALSEDRLMGQIALANAPRDYTPRDQAVVQRLADLYAMAVHRQRTEADLRLHREHLEDLVAERTAAVKTTNEQLQEEVLVRKRVEEALREGERFLSSIFSSILDGICVLDTDMHILRVNPTMEKWYAHALPLVGRKCYEVYHGRSAPCEVCPSLQTLQTGQAAYEVSPLRNETGEIIGWFDLYSFPLVDPATGQLQGVIEYVRDISVRKQAEDALKKTLADLERSNQELEQFAYVASHDLQEPLRMVSSYTQLLARRYQDKLDADAQDFIHYAVDGAERMQRLITDLLAFSRVGTRGKPFAPTDCEVVLAQVLDNLKMTVQETGAVITHDPLPPIMADDSQMAQLFQNLMGNALKFRREAPPQIHLNAEFQGQEWRFSVRDNCIGIAPEFFDRIFIIFQRLHGREDYTGTGIGLAVCKRIVERHGGRIWVESQVGEGSTFYFTIPVRGGKTA